MLKIPLSACFRVMYENQFCWMDQGNSVYFLAVPVILTILINIFFLVSVVKVIRSRSHTFWSLLSNCHLRSKLHFENNFNRNHTDKMMKSAKALIHHLRLTILMLYYPLR